MKKQVFWETSDRKLFIVYVSGAGGVEVTDFLLSELSPSFFLHLQTSYHPPRISERAYFKGLRREFRCSSSSIRSPSARRSPREFKSGERGP